MIPGIGWLSRLLKMDMSYVLRGGFYLSISQFWSATAGLILTIAFANLLDPTIYGTYRYILSAYTILSLLALPGMDTSVMRATSRGESGTLQAGFFAKFRWGLVGSAAVLGIATYYWYNGALNLSVLFLLVSIALPFMESSEVVLAFFNGKRMFRTWTRVEMTVQTVSTLSLVGTIFLTHNLVLILLAYFLPYIVVRSIAVRVFWSENGKPSKELYEYARSMSVFQILSAAGSSIDQIMLYHFLGPVQVAIFSLAQSIPIRIQSLLKISGSLAFPKYANRDSEGILFQLPQKMLIFGIGILVICGAYALIAPFVFSLLFPQYSASIVYSQILVLYTLSAISYPFSSYLTAHKKVKEYYAFGSVSLVLKLLSLFLLVPRYGIWGAVVSVLIAAASTIVITLILLVRERASAK